MVKAANVTLIGSEYIGGGFVTVMVRGGKEGALAARIAGRYKRPAYCFVNREEDQLDTGNRPSGRAHVRVGFKKDGTILGGEIRTWGGTGVAKGGGGLALPSGRYDLGDLKRPHSDVQFNAGGPRPMRAPGNPQAAFVEELMLDEIATLAGIAAATGSRLLALVFDVRLPAWPAHRD